MKEGQGLLILLLFPAILLLGAPFEAKGNNQPICFPSFSWLLEYILPPSCCKSITILLTAPSVMSSLSLFQLKHEEYSPSGPPRSVLPASATLALPLRAYAFSVLTPQWELKALLSGQLPVPPSSPAVTVSPPPPTLRTQAALGHFVLRTTPGGGKAKFGSLHL